MEALSPNEITDELATLKGWVYANNKLSKTFAFGTFREAVSFIVRIAFDAEEQNHHPEIVNIYNAVEINLNTHDAGNVVTKKDIKLARSIESIAWLP